MELVLIYSKLNENDLKESCSHLATRIFLCEKIKELSQNNDKFDASEHPEAPTTSNDNNDSDSGDEDLELIEDLSAITNPLPEFDLDKVLDDAPEGNAIKLDYANNDKLSSQSQNDLCESPKTSSLCSTDQKIKDLFPHTCTAVFYVPPVSLRSSVTGKFEHEESLNWLNRNRSPWSDVEAKWKTTFEIRRASPYSTVDEFLKDWTIFNDSRSTALTAGRIDPLIQKRREDAYENNETVQPYIIGQGSIENCQQILLIVDKVRFEFESIVIAFDCLFKIYHVFHAKVSRQCLRRLLLDTPGDGGHSHEQCSQIVCTDVLPWKNSIVRNGEWWEFYPTISWPHCSPPNYHPAHVP
ncbi:hypothetical protein KQX54_013358 [Cotesia glomerata]|uniref:Uncharacterized protein n=1 Tax=Cotesia glomerata TaxID=32391 RepID=A0AAV7IEW9_COTGL|nr:hypothetical protein KQX54_013358 [Cotesia glomerata]